MTAVEMVFAALLALACVAIGSVMFPMKDNSDSQYERSGMNIHTDALTGCQYLSRGSSITPRMGADGKQICEVKK